MDWLASFGQLDATSAGVLALVFVAAAFVPIPRTVLVLGSGAAFGVKALLVIVPSTTLGCVLAFLLARTLIRPWVERQAGRRPAWRIAAQAVDDEAWRVLALMRFWGPLPNFVQNYAFGITRIGLLPYALITALFTLPQIALYAYLGALGRSYLVEDGASPLARAVLAVAALVVLTIVVLLSRRVRTLLAQRAHVLEEADAASPQERNLVRPSATR